MASQNIISKIFWRENITEATRRLEQNEGLLRGPKLDEFKMYLNKGKDDEMQFVCYKKCKIKMGLTYLFFVLTVGILRLLFHWIPHLYLQATCNKCKIEEAEKILIIEVFNQNHNIYHVRPLQVLTPESVARMKQRDGLLKHHQSLESNTIPALSVHFENGIFRDVDRLLMFSCKKVIYIWDSEKQEFIKLSGLEKDVPTEIFHRYKGLTSNEQFMRLKVYGPNLIDIKEQSILKLISLEVLNPFYIFQLLSFTLWIVDSYVYYAACIMFMTTCGVITSVIQTKKNQKNLKSTIHSSDVCTVLRRFPKKSVNDEIQESEYKSETISTELLVPGDVLEIPAHGCIMHCDAVLLTGNCILNESMLTGESVPVTKTALPNVTGLSYDPKEHGRHTLFCGTHIIQTRYFGNEKVLAIVVRTAFSTSKGSLVRSILYPPPVDFRFEKDSYKFVIFLGILASMGFFYTIISKALRGVDPRDFILEALDLITITVPPALPAAMTVGRFYAQRRLKKNQIFCISPRSINVSGSVDCVCFDKTGTLTEDGLDLLCVVPIENKEFKPHVENVETLPYDVLLYGLVSCHSLTIIDKQIVGDPLDLKMFDSTKWVMEEPEVADNNKFNMIFPTVLKPPKNQSTAQQNLIGDLQIGIIREFPFSSSSQRMGVIMRHLDGTHFEYYCKGSPEMLLKFVKKESVPPDFDDVLESYTQEGYRVIALAHKELKLSYTKVQKVQREVIEKDLDLLGLIVLENRLKPLTTPCIQVLNDANIRVIMVTGDNILTALSVAKDCEIVTTGQSIITVNCDNNHPPNLFYTLTSTKVKIPTDISYSPSIMSLETIESQLQTTTNSTVMPISGSKRPSIMLNNYRFAMTGKIWGIIREYYPELLPRICTRGTIFARMAPDQKQQLVQELQGLGYCVAMCGDGANDCGALRAAHTGISLSEAESSVASPFTSRNPNINCVLNVIKEGRAALVTSFGIFKYMAAYSLCQLISVIILYSIESNLTDIEFLYIDLLIISVFAFFFGRTESYNGKLVKETPLSSLVSVSPIVSLLFQIVLVAIFQVAAFEHLKSEPWYVPLNATINDEDDNVACLENYTIYTVSSFQYIILAIVFSKGFPYRKSIFSNYGLILSAIVMTGISVYLALAPTQFITEQFELVLPQDYNFRLYLLAYAAVNFILSLMVEHLVVEKIFFKKLRFKFHNINKSKRKYLAVERDLKADRKWPILTSDFKSAISPSSPQPVCPAEIVIEKENRFDKNHVLNKLYDTTDSSIVQQRSLPNTPARLPNNFVFSSPKHLQYQINGAAGNNEIGYFSQDDLFSSLPSDTQTSTRSETYKSISNNTNYDLASSNLNIPDLPMDESSSLNSSPIKTPSMNINIEVNGAHNSSNISSAKNSPAKLSLNVKNKRSSSNASGDINENDSNKLTSSYENDNNLSQFNRFGSSPPQNNDGRKHLEMNTLDTYR